MQCPSLQSTSLGRAHRSAPLSLRRITSGSSRSCSSLRQQWHQHQECPQPAQPVVVAAASASAAAPSPSSGGPSSLGGLGVLRTAKPVDRLRYQAKIVFEHFDGDKDGRLNATELSAYLAYAAAKLPADSAELSKLQQDAATLAAAGRALDIEAFDDLFRAQIKACSASPVALPFLKDALAGPNEVPRLQYKTSLPPPELAACLATFRLLDLNGDNYVALADLKAVGGIERDIAEDVLEEADANGDGFLTFEDFLASYAREKPIILNMLVLAAHSAFFWFIINSPLDIMLRVVACGVALLRPQLITNPTIKLFNIVSSIVLRARAEIFMAQQRNT